jgi:hypothetical protein
MGRPKLSRNFKRFAAAMRWLKNSRRGATERRWARGAVKNASKRSCPVPAPGLIGQLLVASKFVRIFNGL